MNEISLNCLDSLNPLLKSYVRTSVGRLLTDEIERYVLRTGSENLDNFEMTFLRGTQKMRPIMQNAAEQVIRFFGNSLERGFSLGCERDLTGIIYLGDKSKQVSVHFKKVRDKDEDSVGHLMDVRLADVEGPELDYWLTDLQLRQVSVEDLPEENIMLRRTLNALLDRRTGEYGLVTREGYSGYQSIRTFGILRSSSKTTFDFAESAYEHLAKLLGKTEANVIAEQVQFVGKHNWGPIVVVMNKLGGNYEISLTRPDWTPVEPKPIPPRQRVTISPLSIPEREPTAYDMWRQNQLRTDPRGPF